MAFDRYDIFFSGTILDNHELVDVRQAVAILFRIDSAQLDILFSGSPIRIKQSVDAETAGQFRAALRKAGALVDIRPTSGAIGPTRVEKTAAEATASPPATAPLSGIEVTEDDTLFELLPANTGTLEDCAPPASPAPQLAIDDIALAQPGAILDGRPPALAANIDTSMLEVLPPNTGSLEDCAEKKPAREIPDISHIGFDNE